MSIEIQEQPIGYGILRLSFQAAQDIYPQLFDIARTTLQGELQAQGVFEELRTMLLLPEDYTIRGIFVGGYSFFGWNVLLASPSVPLAEEGMLYPTINPVYQRNEDGTNSLVEIKIGE